MENKTLGIVTTVLGVLILLSTLYIAGTQLNKSDLPKCPDLKCPEPVIQTVTETVTEEVEVQTDYKQNVVDALLSEVAKDKALRKCDGVKYDEEEIAVKKVYPGFVVEENSDEEVTVSGVKIKLNYDDGKCYRTLFCGLDAEEELSCK